MPIPLMTSHKKSSNPLSRAPSSQTILFSMATTLWENGRDSVGVQAVDCPSRKHIFHRPAQTRSHEALKAKRSRGERNSEASTAGLCLIKKDRLLERPTRKGCLASPQSTKAANTGSSGSKSSAKTCKQARQATTCCRPLSPSKHVKTLRRARFLALLV